MIEVILLCSGQPGSGDPLLEGLSCPFEAVVRLARPGDRWRRPMCVDCAKAFERFCEAEGLPAPLFVLIPDAGELVTDEETRRSGGSSSEPPAPSSTGEGTDSDAEPPEPKKSGGSDVKGE